MDIPSDTTQIPVESLIFGDCPIPNGASTDVDPPNAGNLADTRLLPFLTNGSDPALVNTVVYSINNTSILPPDCSAEAVISIEIPNTLPDNEYVNIAGVTGVDLDTGANVQDRTAAEIRLTTSGLEVAKTRMDL